MGAHRCPILTEDSVVTPFRGGMVVANVCTVFFLTYVDLFRDIAICFTKLLSSSHHYAEVDHQAHLVVGSECGLWAMMLSTVKSDFQ